jgi:hypothetical protein
MVIEERYGIQGKKVVKKEILPHLNQSDGQDFCVL